MGFRLIAQTALVGSRKLADSEVAVGEPNVQLET